VSGRRWFISGLAATWVFGLAHLGGFLQAARTARDDPRMSDLTRAMQAHKTNILGFHPSILDFREYFSLNFSILLWLAAKLIPGYSVSGILAGMLGSLVLALANWALGALFKKD